jgi:hypothetical protein
VIAYSGNQQHHCDKTSAMPSFAAASYTLSSRVVLFVNACRHRAATAVGEHISVTSTHIAAAQSAREDNCTKDHSIVQNDALR